MSDARLLGEVRAALRVEMAGVCVGVAAPQLRGRIAARERSRRRTRTRIAMVVAAVLGVAAALPVAGGLVLPAATGPSPGGVQPASVATVDPESGDLVLAWAWPDGRSQAGTRYPGALELARQVTGDASLDRLPAGSVATAGPEERLAVALPTGHILVYRSPGGRGAATRVVEGEVEATWLGWAADGRLVAVGRPFAAPDARLRVRLVDPDTGAGVEGTLRYRISPHARGMLLTWTSEGTILAIRRDPGRSTTTIGSLDIANGRASFEPGLPPRLRVATGLEPALARDGTSPRGWGDGDEPGWSSVGVGAADDDGTPDVRWYAAETGERILDVVRSADLHRLVALVARPDGTSARVVVVDWPGSWRDAVSLPDGEGRPPPDAGTGAFAGATDTPSVVGLAPDGRAIAVAVAGRLVVADLATGASVELPPGTVFVGWPEPTIAVTDAVPTAPACVVPSTATAASIALATPGTRTPADSGARPVMGDRADPDPWRRSEMRTASAFAATVGGRLVLAPQAGTCVDAVRADAIGIGSAPEAVPIRLSARGASGPATAGLVELVAPPPGDWVVRVTLWLEGADREAILLYRVTVTEPGDAGVAS